MSSGQPKSELEALLKSIGCSEPVQMMLLRKLDLPQFLAMERADFERVSFFCSASKLHSMSMLVNNANGRPADIMLISCIGSGGL